MKVGKVWPVPYVTSLAAYSLTINGRRLDSFIPTGGLDGKPAVLDNGTGYFLPPGSATWDAAKDTVTFHIRRDYLADQQVKAPYNVYAVTGLHARTNDWVKTLDVAPDARNLNLAAPKLGKETRDAPKAKKKTSKTYQAGVRILHSRRLDPRVSAAWSARSTTRTTRPSRSTCSPRSSSP